MDVATLTWTEYEYELETRAKVFFHRLANEQREQNRTWNDGMQAMKRELLSWRDNAGTK